MVGSLYLAASLWRPGLLRLERGAPRPTPARDRRVLYDLGVGPRIVLREPCPPLKVGNERRAKLQVVASPMRAGSRGYGWTYVPSRYFGR